ncbi:MAG: mandelate racemase/muconate lactonizing enzyme family protein [Alphaproteobacteria bacterium]
MKISAVEAIPLSIPFSHGGRPQGWGGRPWERLDIVVVKVETDAGITGYGEAFSYNCRRAVGAAVDDMVAPLAVGREADDIAALMREIQLELHLFGRYGITMFAISGLDIALWDIAGKAAGLPLRRLLGGAAKASVPCYASLFKYLDAELVAARTRQALEEGYRYIKLHERALPEVRAAREAAGAGVPLMLDVNCAWSAEEARTIVPELIELELHWLEEPIWPPENFAGLADLQDSFGIAIAAGENACTAWQFAALIEAGAVSYAQPSVTKVGGVSEMQKVAALAEVAGLALAPHAPYFGPGFLATLQFTAALPGEVLCERLHVELEASLSGAAIDPVDGALAVPDGPGLGLEPDADVIKDYRVD